MCVRKRAANRPRAGDAGWRWRLRSPSVLRQGRAGPRIAQKRQVCVIITRWHTDAGGTCPLVPACMSFDSSRVAFSVACAVHALAPRSLTAAATGNAHAGGGARGTRQKRKAAITSPEPKSVEEPSLHSTEGDMKQGSHGQERNAGSRAPSRREKAKVGACVAVVVVAGGGGTWWRGLVFRLHREAHKHYRFRFRFRFRFHRDAHKH